MAIFFFRMNPVGRLKEIKTEKGTKVIHQSATKGISYRTGERIVDQRTGCVYDFSQRVRDGEILGTMIFNNENLSREKLWNLAELSEKKRNARVARESIVALPHELGIESYKNILSDYAKQVVNMYGVAVDIAIHAPGKEGDHRNFHAHIYCTTRIMEKGGRLGKKSEIEWDGTSLKAAGLPSGKQQLRNLKIMWEKAVNKEFEKLGMDERIDHRREIQEQKIPQIHVGPWGTQLGRRGRGHESSEWQINQAIKAFNNVVSINDARKNLMQTQQQKNKQSDAPPLEIYGGIAATQEAAEEAQKQVKKRINNRQDQEFESTENERWKPAHIDPNKGSVINMFHPDADGVYRWTRGKNDGIEAFRDGGNAIYSQTTNNWAIAAELELAQQKVSAGEWREIRAFGTDEYRRAAWIQGATMGLDVKGYTPTDQELLRYGQRSGQGLAGDQETAAVASKNRFQSDPKFQSNSKFHSPNTSSEAVRANQDAANGRAPKM